MSKSFVYRKGAVIMYHISVLTGRQDEDDFGERLRDVARVEYCPPGDEEELADRLEDADVIICKSEPITASLLEELDDLKLIVVLSTRSDNVDLAAAREKGVMVINNTSYCVDDIADHTCAMILALIRQLPEYQSDIRTNSRWEYGSVPWPIHRVSSNLIGLVGFGHVGRAVAARLQAFGCKIEEMKEGSMFVNCCRGGLADEAALYHAVDDGHIRSAALDVLSMEHPSPMLLKMIARPEFLLTPSVCFHSVEAERYIRLFLAGHYDELPVVTLRDNEES